MMNDRQSLLSLIFDYWDKKMCVKIILSRCI